MVTTRVAKGDWGQTWTTERWFSSVLIDEPRWHDAYFWPEVAALAQVAEVQHRWFDSKGQAHVTAIKASEMPGGSALERLQRVFQLPSSLAAEFRPVFLHVCERMAPALAAAVDSFLAALSPPQTQTTPSWAG